MQDRAGVIAGAAFMVGGMAIIGLIDNFVKEIAAEAGLWQFHLTRSAMVCAAIPVIAWGLGVSLIPRRKLGVLLRSIFGALSMAVYFGALGVMPIAQVGAGLFTAPIFVLVLSVVFFGQGVGVVRVIAAAVGFAGVLLVLQPDLRALELAVVLPMAAGLTWALTALTTRHLCEGEHVLTLLFGFFATLGVVGALGLWAMAVGLGDGQSFATRGWVAPTGAFWFWTGIQAAGSLLAVSMLTRAYQLGETSYIAPFEYSFLVFAGAWGFLINDEVLGPGALLGVGLIMLAGGVIAWRSGDRTEKEATVPDGEAQGGAGAEEQGAPKVGL
ncbi:MAG: DMT family transporter [Pseudomonadota bacterium]